MEDMSNSQEIHEFRILLKKVVIPFEKFFRSNENDVKNTHLLNLLRSEIES